MRRRNSYAAAFPCYTIDPSGNPRYLGKFSQAQPIRTWVYRALEHDQFLARTGYDWPITPWQSDIDFTADLIAAAAKLYQEKLGGTRFLVMLHPFAGGTQLTPRLITALVNRSIPILDYSHILDQSDTSFTFSDHHPTPRCNAIIAQQLATDLASAI